MIKGLQPEVAKAVGKSAAIMLMQLMQWFKTKDVKKVYRTNDEMFEDLDGLLSIATIQRSKQRLIENGYVVVTFDKGLNRTTHYELTAKGKELLHSLTNKVETKVETKTETAVKTTSGEVKKSCAVNQKVLHEKRQHSFECKSNNAAEHNTAMKASFEEGFTNKNAVPMPENILALLKGFVKQEAKPEVKQEAKTQEQVEWETIVKAEMEMLEDEELTEDDYAQADLAMLQAVEHASNHAPEARSMTFTELMKSAYSKAATEAQEALYAMQQDVKYFREEF